MVDKLARRVGKVWSGDEPSGEFEGDYIRVWASIDVQEPVIRFALETQGVKHLLLDVKYEKIGYFSELCGVLGHTMETARLGCMHQRKIRYGKWLLAKRRVSSTSLSLGALVQGAVLMMEGLDTRGPMRPCPMRR